MEDAGPSEVMENARPSELMGDARPSELMEARPPSSQQLPSSPSAASSETPLIIGAPGGPLFMSSFVSPSMSVRIFQGTCVALLTAIQAELDDPLIQQIDTTDILVDDLRIVTEEQLVNYGLQELVEPEEKANEEVVRASDNSTGQSNSSSGLRVNSNAVTETNAPIQMESQVQQVVICADENVEQNSCLSSPPPLKLKPRGRKRRKRDGVRRLGRPFDRNVRAAAWEKGGALLEESMFGKLKKERETARRNCSLRCLSLKDQQRPSSMRFDRHRRLQALNFFNAPLKVEMMAGMSDVELIKEYEVILWIEVVRPTTRQKGQHFLVLGSQMLTTLRDKIYCLTDKLMQKLNYFLPSGYFCIENVFYNDMRDPDAIDYSDPILKWMQYQGSKGLCNPYGTRAADMATTSFLDLEFCVGKQYTYCHQGNCKHMLMIRDMRLIHKEDVQNALLYPLLRSPFRVHLRKCTICAIYIATKVTVDDKMAPESPCFYCDYCYYVQHYSQDGRLLYNDFRVYDYYHE